MAREVVRSPPDGFLDVVARDIVVVLPVSSQSVEKDTTELTFALHRHWHQLVKRRNENLGVEDPVCEDIRALWILDVVA